MDSRQFVNRGGILLGLGSFIASVPSLATIPGPAIFEKILISVGLGIGSTGIIFVIIPFIPKWEEELPTVRRVKRNDLKLAHSFCGRIFGDNFASFNSVKHWFNHNDKMFWMVERTKRIKGITIHEITGFYSILPLSSSGHDHLISGQLDGRKFTTEHLTSNFSEAKAYYIGGIASRGGKSKAVALGSLMTAVSELHERLPLPIYTRPTTKDGLRLAAKKGFEALDGSGAKDLDKIYHYSGDGL